MWYFRNSDDNELKQIDWENLEWKSRATFLAKKIGSAVCRCQARIVNFLKKRCLLFQREVSLDVEKNAFSGIAWEHMDPASMWNYIDTIFLSCKPDPCRITCWSMANHEYNVDMEKTRSRPDESCQGLQPKMRNITFSLRGKYHGNTYFNSAREAM